MKTELRIADHNVLPGQKIFEIYYEDRLVGTVCGADGPGVRIVSKHPVTIIGDVSMVTEVRIDKEKLL